MISNKHNSLIDLFNFIDKAKISGTLSFPLREGGLYNPDEPLARRLWYTAELTNKRINDFSEDEFQLAAIEKAGQTLASINLDVISSAKNIATALDKYLSAIREVEAKINYLKSLTDQELYFNNDEELKLTPPGNIVNLEFIHHSALVEFLTNDILIWLKQQLYDDVTVLKHTSKYLEFLEILNKRIGIKKQVTKNSNTKEPINSFAEAAANEVSLQTMHQILLNKKVIDNQHNLIGTATLLYSLIKLFKRLGYFKKIFYKDLHPLVNTAFKTDRSFQAFNQTEPYDKAL